MVYLELAAIAVLPVVVSVLLYFLDRNTKFNKIDKRLKQVIYGVIFGGLAILGTELGVDLGGVRANARDAAVITAGLCFGAPAGIISAVIGSVERYAATYWGVGTYTQVACTVSTLLSGLIAALLRRFMFGDKMPSALYALAIGIFCEVFHMLMIFFTHMSDVATAFEVVEKCAAPMIIVNGLAVMLSVIAITLIERYLNKPKPETAEVVPEAEPQPSGAAKRGGKQITVVFQRWLLLCVVFAFCLTVLFTFILQYSISVRDTNNLLSLNINDVEADISDASDENLLSITYTVAAEYEDGEDISSIQQKYSVAEINVIDSQGVITESTYAPFINYNMADGTQSAEFLVLLEGETEYVQSYQPTSSDSSLSRKYAGVVLNGGGFIQVGYDAEQFQQDIAETVNGLTRNRHIGQSGYLIITDENFVIVSDMNGGEDSALSVTGITVDFSAISQNTRFDATVYDSECYCMYEVTEGFYIISVLPVSEAVFSRNISMYVTIFIEVVIFILLFGLIYFLTKKLVVDNIDRINDDLARITGGDLDVVVDVRPTSEFASLSDDINSTVQTLKQYIAEAAARIDKELEFAQAIQLSALPSVFPPYPDKKEMDIYAVMQTAKEVGGDFYDFYFVGDNKLAVLIADVSGKGIPAAMFMMTAKTLIKGFAESGRSPEEVFTLANNKLCESNEANMFVTAWLACIDLNTGDVEYANAGHNPPLVRRGNEFEYLKVNRGFVLGGMDGIRYKKGSFKLGEGDALFLYTDGVTEAVNEQEQLYGNDNLLASLKRTDGLTAEQICKAAKSDVEAFAGEAPQADDITVLCFILNKLSGDTQ